MTPRPASAQPSPRLCSEQQSGKGMARKRVAKPSRVSAPILWMGLCVVLATVVVQTTRSGIDILALLIAGFILLVLERTLGDWVAESVGPAPTALIFALVAGICVAYVTTDSGRGRAERLLVAAEARGYRAAYFRQPTGNEKPLPDVRPTLPGLRGIGG